MNASDTAGRPVWVTVLLLLLTVALVVVFVLLGNWQMRRLHWKLDLIEAVETRAYGPAVPVPATFDPARHDYLKVRFSGHPDVARSVLVKAVTGRGPGYWVMTPWQTGQGPIWVNRGYVPADRTDPDEWAMPQPQVIGLLRAGETGGTFLERNDAATGRWVSRDPAALSQAAGLDPAAGFFVDALTGDSSPAWPRAGMTRLDFRNPHLSYALTWYAMALLLAITVTALVVRAFRRG